MKKSMPSCRVPVSITRFKSNLNFDIFPKNPQILNFTKICPVAAKLLHVETYMTKLTAALQNVANTPNNIISAP